MSEIDRVQSTTTFNEQSLLDGSFTNKGLQVGAESGGDTILSVCRCLCQSTDLSSHLLGNRQTCCIVCCTVDLVITINAGNMRNKVLAENQFNKKRASIGTGVSKNKAARNYYKNMNNTL